MPKLEHVGKILASGFGDRVLAGIFLGFLENITPARAYEYIKDNKQLGYWMKEATWEKFRRMTKDVNVGNITFKDIADELRKSRPDILSVIINTPGGSKWLDTQILEVKKKLGLT